MRVDRKMLEAAASLFGFGGDLIIDVEFGGAHVAVVIELIEEEHLRRQEVRLGAVVDRDLWQVLATLPYRQSIPWSSIEPVAAAVLDTTPNGIVKSDPDAVERIIRPAVHVAGVLSVDSRWRHAVDRASRFSAHASRASLVLKPISRRAAERARQLGIGLASVSEGRLELNVQTTSTRPVPGPRNFRFCETVYEFWLRTRSTRTVPTP